MLGVGGWWPRSPHIIPYFFIFSNAIGSGIYLNRIRYAEISADSSAENWEATLAVLEQELRRARLHGFTEAELNRVKQEVVTRLENAVREAPTRNSTTLARSIIRNLAGDRVIQSPAQEMSNLLSAVESASVAQLLQVFEESGYHSAPIGDPLTSMPAATLTRPAPPRVPAAAFPGR